MATSAATDQADVAYTQPGEVASTASTDAGQGQQEAPTVSAPAGASSTAASDAGNKAAKKV